MIQTKTIAMLLLIIDGLPMADLYQRLNRAYEITLSVKDILSTPYGQIT